MAVIVPFLLLQGPAKVVTALGTRSHSILAAMLISTYQRISVYLILLIFLQELPGYPAHLRGPDTFPYIIKHIHGTTTAPHAIFYQP